MARGEGETANKRWSEAEKLEVFFSFIKNHDKISWGDVKVPDGRTLKGVKCMIDTEKKKMEKGKETGSKSAGDDDDDAAPQTPKTSPSKRKRATKAGTEDGDTPSKKPRGTRQKAAKKQEPKDGEENDFAVKKELESDVEDDTIKFENGEEV